MKITEIKKLSAEELKQKVALEKETFAKMKFSHAVSPIENPAKLRETRRFIARLQTELNSR
jgi:large subunit ribosomal protein L29